MHTHTYTCMNTHRITGKSQWQDPNENNIATNGDATKESDHSGGGDENDGKKASVAGGKKKNKYVPIACVYVCNGSTE